MNFRRLQFFGMCGYGFAPYIRTRWTPYFFSEVCSLQCQQYLFCHRTPHTFACKGCARFNIQYLSFNYQQYHLQGFEYWTGFNVFSLTKNSLWLTVPLLLVLIVHELICNNLSRLMVPPMYRSSELLQEPIDGLEPPTYRLQDDCTAIVLYRHIPL